MKKISFLYILFCIISLTSCREDTTGTGDGRQQHVLTYKVAVIMPASQQERWERTAQWALENLEEAQDTFSTKVRLQLEWFDEDDEENLADFARRVDADPQYKAIIGPIVKLIKQGKSYEEVRSNIESAYPKVNTDDLEDALARDDSTALHGCILPRLVAPRLACRLMIELQPNSLCFEHQQ